eukprot:12413581-Karenia_brevis.AAC.1
MGLELLAVSLALCTFREHLSGKQVIIHCDKQWGRGKRVMELMVAIRRGTARKMDHAQLVHQQWLFAVTHRMHLYIKRVPTADNIADLPSRQ